MRFMIIVKATKDSEAGVMPEEALLAEMARYHEELAKAGVLLDGSGLQSSARRVAYQVFRKGKNICRRPLHRGQGTIAGTRSSR